MIWLTLARAGVALSFVGAVMDLYGKYAQEVKPNRLYSSEETARLLGLDRAGVLDLIKKDQLRGRLINGNYLIPGTSILDYLNQ